MSSREDIKEELMECVEKIIIDYDIDLELTEVESRINRLVDALVFDEDQEDEWDEDDLIEYRDDIDEFFGE